SFVVEKLEREFDTRYMLRLVDTHEVEAGYLASYPSRIPGRPEFLNARVFAIELDVIAPFHRP
ncbi:MAG: hypothetical protein RBT73_09845, partial [Spirochaetia bacterium]|nr:hypothetical protein [Spirochaetia bacterium]